MSNVGPTLPVDFGWPGEALSQWEGMLPQYGPGLLRRFLGFFAGDPVGGQTIAVPAAATPLVVPDMANSALLSVEAANVRLRLDGQDATALLRHLLGPGTMLTLTGRITLQAVSLFQAAPGAIVHVTYFS